MRALLSPLTPLRSLVMAPLFLILLIRNELQILLIMLKADLDIPTDAKAIGKSTYGTILLMIAFILGTIVIAIGGRVLGIPDIKIRIGLSLTFFALIFVVLVIYQNLTRRFG